MAKNYTFTNGDLVFAKCKGYPPWPARIDDKAKVGKLGKNRMAVFFFGTHEVGAVAIKDLLPYAEFREQLGKPQNRKGFMDALWEIKHKPTLTIDGMTVKEITTENVKNDKKNSPPKKSVYSDIDSDSNDLIIDENIDIKARLKKTKAVMQANKNLEKRKIEEEDISLTESPSVPLTSRKRLKLEDPPTELVNMKKPKRLAKKANDDVPVKLKIKIKSTSSAVNNKKETSVRRTARMPAKSKEPQPKSSFIRKDYLQDSRSRSRHLVMEDTVKPTSKQQKGNIADEVLKVKQTDSGLGVGSKLSLKTNASDLQEEKTKVTSKALTKRELKEESKLTKEIAEPVITRTRCGRIVRTPAALDRDEEIIGLPGFKRNVTRQNAKKEVASSRLEPPSVPAKKKRIAKQEDKMDVSNKETVKSNAESEGLDVLSESKSESKLLEESEDKIVMTIRGLKSSKLSATRKKANNRKAKKNANAKPVQKSKLVQDPEVIEKNSSDGENTSTDSSNDRQVDEEKVMENRTAAVKLIKGNKRIEEQAAAADDVEEQLEEMFDDSPGQLVIVENQEESESSNDRPIHKLKSKGSKLDEQQSKQEGNAYKKIENKAKPEPSGITKEALDEIVLGNEETELKKEEPVLTKDKSELTNEEPALTNEEPASNNEEPASNNEETGSTNEEPASNNEETGSTNEEPESTNEEPGSTNKEPGSTNEEPGSTNEEPASTSEEPASTNEESASTNEESASTSEEPASTSEAPASTNEEAKLKKKKQESKKEQSKSTKVKPGSKKGKSGSKKGNSEAKSEEMEVIVQQLKSTNEEKEIKNDSTVSHLEAKEEPSSVETASSNETVDKLCVNSDSKVVKNEAEDEFIGHQENDNPEKSSTEQPEVAQEDNVTSTTNNSDENQGKEQLLQKKRAEKEEEKNRKKREKYEQKKREKLNRLKVEEKLHTLNHKIIDSLHLGEQVDMDQCLEAMIELDTISLNASILKSNPDIIATIKKCRKYKNCDIVKKKAEDLFYKFKDMCLGGEGDSYNYLFASDRSSRTSSKSFSTDTEVDTSTDNQDLNGAPSCTETGNGRLPNISSTVGQSVEQAKPESSETESSKVSSSEHKNEVSKDVCNNSGNVKSTSNNNRGTKPKKR